MGQDDLSGAVLDGRYKVIAPIADGAMGSVYRAERVMLGRAVAIKIMHDALPDEMASRQRFDREAKLMARLEHPNCVSVIDFGVHDEKPYLVMELVRGTSLLEVIEKGGRIDPARAAGIMRQVLSGLAHAHELGIIHRDIKPANIMVSEQAGLGEQVRILDFGLARLTEGSTKLTRGIVVGTPNYMAPEQCRGGDLSARTDLYACGVVMFEMLTGRKPFQADDPIGVVRKHLNQPPPKLADFAPDLRLEELEGICARALSKDPADRFESAVEMSAAIEEAIGRFRKAGAALAAKAIPEGAMLGGGAAQATASGWNTPAELIGSSAIVAVSEAPPEQIGSSAILAVREAPPEQIGSSAILAVDAPPPPPAAPPRLPTGPSVTRAATPRPDAHDPHEESLLKRMLPKSRMKWAALAGGILVVAAFYGIIAGKHKLQERTGPHEGSEDIVIDEQHPDHGDSALVDQINKMIDDDDQRAALDVALRGRKQYPDSAPLAFVAGKLYFNKLYWTDGLKAFRDAIRLQPDYRTDPQLIKTVLRGFITTPYVDDRIETFLREDIGTAAVPYLEETERDHPNPTIRQRAAAELRRIK